MSDRFANKMNGKGTNQILQDEIRKRKASGPQEEEAGIADDGTQKQKHRGDVNARAVGSLKDEQQQNMNLDVYPRRTRHCRHPRNVGRCRHCMEVTGGTSSPEPAISSTGFCTEQMKSWQQARLSSTGAKGGTSGGT